MDMIREPWKISEEDVLTALGVSPGDGLGKREALERLRKYGFNRLVEARPASALSILAAQFKSLIVLLLVGAALASATALAGASLPESAAIAAVIILNAAIGFFTEIRAVRSMEALYRMVRVEATVLRDGSVSVIRAEELVPGDIIVLEAGDVVPADVRLIEASRVESNESTLTGESVPVRKFTDTLTGDIPLAERFNMVFMGTALTKGSARGVVTATGQGTYAVPLPR